MKLNSYLIESNKSDEEKFEDFVLSVKRDCKPWLNAVSKCERKTLVRGYHPKNDIELITTRKDRRPRDTDKPLHKSVNKEFKKTFGWKVRSEGVFTFGGKIVGGYGISSGIVFPVGKFEFVWSKEIEDFFMFTSQKIGQYKPPGVKNSKEEQEYREKWSRNVVKKYSDKDLCKALNSTSEIVIKCDKYWIIRKKFLLSIHGQNSDIMASKMVDDFIENTLL